MRDEDRIRILHMIDAGESIARFVAGRHREDLDSDQMLLFAIVHAIEIFGEAASRISSETRVAAPQVAWGTIVSMRNRLIHGYFDTDATIVWNTAILDISVVMPALRLLVCTPG